MGPTTKRGQAKQTSYYKINRDIKWYVSIKMTTHNHLTLSNTLPQYSTE